ncbi:IS1182 family transposase [Candidatus Chloroploca asiatica]|uniref:Transposase n=1 Tax=Candidatus Chloroploca asiatica TaxID=1506545 RepID=A0A2H3LF00_9CHLR|nr:IS1182 family transposase [Candidatus Chloroploca asiatica]PDW01377.1 transposase [Candidatus Chloroploca asiatica]
MSMHEPLLGDYPIPEETARIARQVFPKGNVYMQLRDHFGMLYNNADFAHLFAREGQPALAPARLALVTVMQYMEGISDRQAADFVRDRISWKYALGLPLDDPGFDFSVLSEFRARLLTSDAERLLFDTVLELFRQEGLLKARGKQRSDSTAVLGAVRMLHRLEHVGETLRHALNTLAHLAPAWLRQVADPAWVERYGHRIEQYRFPKAEAQRQALAVTIGQDGYQLLTACWSPDAPDGVRSHPAVETLRRVWLQQYYRSDAAESPEVSLRLTSEQPPSAQIISSPYDPEARYTTKRETRWVGYKLHLTETCDDETPNLITHVATTPAPQADCTMTAPIQEALAAKELLPQEHYLDRGYVDADHIVQSARTHQIELVGPVITDPSWQARTPGGISLAQFVLDWEAQQAICPRGIASQSWSPAQDQHGNEMIVIHFPRSACRACDDQANCTKAKDGARTLSVRPQAHHEAIQMTRTQQQTGAFRKKYRRRAGIEGTFTQANRRCDLRHARYIGLAKVRLQHLITAIALNLFRALAWLAEVPRAQTRTSAFAKLMG